MKKMLSYADSLTQVAKMHHFKRCVIKYSPIEKSDL